MVSKKESKIAREQQKIKKKRKDKWVLVSGIIIFTFAIFQAIILIIYFADHDAGHNKIILGNKVVTSEVCEQWFNYLKVKPSNVIPSQTFYYNDTFSKHPIPKDVVVEVCNKWKKIKEEIDANE